MVKKSKKTTKVKTVKKVSKTKASKTKVSKKVVSKTKKSSSKTKAAFPRIKVENVVASAAVDAEIDLDKIAATLPNAEYEPEQFPGLVLRQVDPKAVILVFSSGKMVCTGTKEPRQIKDAVDKTIKQIRSVGITIKGKAKITVQNIVASSDLGVELNLDQIAVKLENAEFEPEQFPGLVFRVFDPKVVFLLFRSGKIVCTGAKKRVDVTRGVERLLVELKKIKAM